ncbi:hypothetical protein TWF679_001685 [Orbilia oligospora]|uniref:Uncharacterized protein n=1 Tax=Orbilia oligospora TaxID=2813651 RepID=A0A8H8UV22_ORBOL|nr:hypothetical protein TWF679_001685 [Orbilia oligospora]
MVEMSVSSQTEVIGVWTPINITHSDWEALPHDSRGGILIGIQVTAAAIAVTTVSLRLYTRKFVTRTIGIDDYLMAAVLFLVYFRPATTYGIQNQGIFIQYTRYHGE